MRRRPDRTISLGELARDNPKTLLVQYTPTLGGPLLPLRLARARRLLPKLRITITSHEKTSTYRQSLPRILYPIFRRYEHAVLSRADSILVHTREHATELSRLFPDIQQRIHQIPFGMKNIQPVERMHSGQLKLLYLGSIRPGKGLETIIEGAGLISKHAPVELLIAGTAPPKYAAYLTHLKDLAGSSHEATIRFLGYVPPVEIRHLLRDADMGVLPHNRVTHSQTLHTYLEENLPLIMSDATPFLAAEKEGLGITFRRGSPGEMAKATLALWNNRALYNEIISRQKAYAHLHQWERVAPTIMTFL
jgi:glycosyltransferase involved in cell wall biosynthesis